MNISRLLAGLTIPILSVLLLIAVFGSIERAEKKERQAQFRANVNDLATVPRGTIVRFKDGQVKVVTGISSGHIGLKSVDSYTAEDWPIEKAASEVYVISRPFDKNHLALSQNFVLELLY